jgi:hypothetical protein
MDHWEDHSPVKTSSNISYAKYSSRENMDTKYKRSAYGRVKMNTGDFVIKHPTSVEMSPVNDITFKI